MVTSSWRSTFRFPENGYPANMARLPSKNKRFGVLGPFEAISSVTGDNLSPRVAVRIVGLLS
jgi:hypothetical protein